jgi:hypothetical protein
MSKIKNKDQEKGERSASPPPQSAPPPAGQQNLGFGHEPERKSKKAAETEPQRIRRQAQGVMAYEIDLKAKQPWVSRSSGEGMLRPSKRRLSAIQARLRDGNTVADCVRVLNELAQECLRRQASRTWWNGTTEWRPANFERVLGSRWSAVITDVVTDRGEIEPKQVPMWNADHPVARAHRNPDGPGYLHPTASGPISIQDLWVYLDVEGKRPTDVV